MSVLLLILGLVLFIGLVVVHEFGHFIVAKRNGIEVEEFGIGFPPRAKIVSKKNGTLFTINWLPLGGFVKLKGEHDADTDVGSFGAARLSAKVRVMLAGVVMNLLTAFVLLTILAVLGIPKLIDNQFTVKSDTKIVKQESLVGYIEPNSPASKAGLQIRDKLESIGEKGGAQHTIQSIDSFPAMTKELAGQEVTLEYRRADRLQSVNLKLRTIEEVDASKKTNNPKGHLGLAPTEYIIQRSTWSAPIVAGGLIRQFTELTLGGIGSALLNLFKGNTTVASAQVSGPVGIFILLKDGSLLGYQFILMIVAVISLTLAIMNVLPIPALDGGRLFVTLVFRVIGKPLKKKTEDLIHGSGFILLMLLFVLITIVDVKRNF